MIQAPCGPPTISEASALQQDCRPERPEVRLPKVHEGSGTLDVTPGVPAQLTNVMASPSSSDVVTTAERGLLSSMVGKDGAMSFFGRRPTVGGYWGTRVQSSQEVALTMRAFLDDLAAIGPELALPWVSTAEFDKVPADLSVDGLVRIFEHSRSNEMGYSDTPGPGYSIGLSPEDGTARRIIAGVGGLETSAPNSVRVSLPTETQLTDSTRQLPGPDIGDAIMKVIVKHWKPDRARWSIGDYIDLQNRSKGEVEVGWETYFHSGVTFDRSALPQSAVVEELSTGTLIRLGDKPMEVAAADIVAVRAALGYPV